LFASVGHQHGVQLRYGGEDGNALLQRFQRGRLVEAGDQFGGGPGGDNGHQRRGEAEHVGERQDGVQVITCGDAAMGCGLGAAIDQVGMGEHHALGVAGGAGGVEQGCDLVLCCAFDGFGGRAVVVRDLEAEAAKLDGQGISGVGVGVGVWRDLVRIDRDGGAGMGADAVDLGCRQPRVDRHRPGIAHACRHQQHRQRIAVFAHQHEAVARLEACFGKLPCRCTRG
jgi:hypothetical protein